MIWSDLTISTKDLVGRKYRFRHLFIPIITLILFYENNDRIIFIISIKGKKNQSINKKHLCKKNNNNDFVLILGLGFQPCIEFQENNDFVSYSKMVYIQKITVSLMDYFEIIKVILRVR